MPHRTSKRDYLEEPNRDPLAILTPEARAVYVVMPACYRRFKIMELLAYEAGLKNPRRNQSFADLFELVKRRCEHLP
ncbi:MAG: hypothetical protein AMXMBFR7_48890 [Planctomycetota bacterium]